MRQVRPRDSVNVGQVAQILRDCKFPGFTLRVIMCGQRMHMQGSFATNGETQFTRKWYISNKACKNEVVNTAFKLVLTAMEHEVRELFTYKERKIFGPHYDVDVLAGICGLDKNLDYRRH